MRWYHDLATRQFKLNHDVDHPEAMTTRELVDTLTHIYDGYLSSPYAVELCRRAGNLELWSAKQTRRQAVHEAAVKFGFQFL